MQKIKYKKKSITHRTPKFNAGWIHLKLGEMYYYGIETEPDHKKALIHFKNAAASGVEEATHFLKLLTDFNP